MTKHVASNLSKGRLEIDLNSRVIRIISKTGNYTIHEYQYSDLEFSDWGYIYEKYVGQNMKKKGIMLSI